AGRFAFEWIDRFGQLLERVAFVFSRFAVAVGFRFDLAFGVVAGFGRGPVGGFDFGLLVVGVVGVFRFVAEGVGELFEVPVFVVGVFRFVPERVGDLDRPLPGVAFGFRFEFFGFGAFFVAAR